jgi:F0F1-type ATP synthase epsilon subunit
VLAEEALPLAEADRAAAQARLKEAELAIEDSRDDDERAGAESMRAVAQALIEAIDYFKAAG